MNPQIIKEKTKEGERIIYKFTDYDIDELSKWIVTQGLDYSINCDDLSISVIMACKEDTNEH